MANPQETIQEQIKEALRAGDKERLATLRLLLAAIKNEKISAGKEVDQAGFLQLVRKAIKQRKDSTEQYRKGGREELAAKEEREAEILARYLPPQVDEETLRSAIADLVKEQKLSGPAAIGTIMKTMMAKYAGQAEGGTINKIARDVLGL
jgi:uncharacterized protein YqeY